ncbi:hypothetical protein J6590_086186 [Homalodisca vitripennis]|nr:hypothetical protein J6590_086186 [Homalodisca vitripennis]
MLVLCFRENVRESFIYQWLEALKEFLQDTYVSSNNFKLVEDVEDSSSKKLNNTNSLKITHGEPVIDREVFSTLLANKKISQATHNIYAYRVLHEGCMDEQCDDDGEKAAGGRLLHLLQEGRLKHLHQTVDWQSNSIYTRITQTVATGATNVMVVVSRWRGGVNIGPDRYRHINSVARQALQQLGFVKKSSDKILLIRQRSVCARGDGP